MYHMIISHTMVAIVFFIMGFMTGVSYKDSYIKHSYAKKNINDDVEKDLINTCLLEKKKPQNQVYPKEIKQIYPTDQQYKFASNFLVIIGDIKDIADANMIYNLLSELGYNAYIKYENDIPLIIVGPFIDEHQITTTISEILANNMIGYRPSVNLALNIIESNNI